jgi:hypothetical protein
MTMRASLLLVLVGAALGCEGKGTGSATGTLFVNQCTADTSLGSASAPVNFDLHPTYFVAVPQDDIERPTPAMSRVFIRVQSEGTQIEESDGIIIQIADVAQVAAQVGGATPVGPNTNARATLSLLSTCPLVGVQLELDGNLFFTRFGTPNGDGAVTRLSFGDPLTATFDFTVVDRRALTLGGFGNVTTQPMAGGHLTGGFDFVITQGQAQRF